MKAGAPKEYEEKFKRKKSRVWCFDKHEADSNDVGNEPNDADSFGGYICSWLMLGRTFWNVLTNVVKELESSRWVFNLESLKSRIVDSSSFRLRSNKSQASW